MNDTCEDNALAWDNATLSWNDIVDFNYQTHQIGWIVCAILVLMASSVSLTNIKWHLRNYHKPIEQREIVRILLIVPIYTILSWWSFYRYRYAVYFDLIRDIYEAFVIYSFFSLMLVYLGSNHHVQHIALLHKPSMRYPPPMCCVSYAPSSPFFLTSTRNLVLQYVVIKPTMAFVAIGTQLNHNYCADSNSLWHGHFWVSVINIVSVSVSMFGLIVLFLTIKDDISQHSPGGKMLIGTLVNYDVVPASAHWTRTNVASGILALLVCFEMLLTGIWHIYTFPITPYVYSNESGIVTTRIRESLVDVFNYAETIKEIGRAFQFVSFWVGSKMTKVASAASIDDESPNSVQLEMHVDEM